MKKHEILDFFSAAEKEGAQDKNRDETVVLELPQFLSFFEASLPESAQERFIQLAESFLRGEFGIITYRRRHDESNGKIWISRSEPALLRESNLFLRLTDNLGKLIQLGTHILGADQPRALIDSLLNTVSGQPIVKALREAGADHIECWLLMNLVLAHFDGHEYIDLYKAGQRTQMPTSYLARLSTRIHNGHCTLSDADFIDSGSGTSLFHLLHLRPKTLMLIANPYAHQAD